MVMEDYNLLDYNQHQPMKRAPTLVIGPSLVFLAPSKKGQRSPILKCKILLASLMPISDCHQSAAPLLCSSTMSSLLINTVGHCQVIKHQGLNMSSSRSVTQGVHHRVHSVVCIITSSHHSMYRRVCIIECSSHHGRASSQSIDHNFTVH